MKQIFKELFSGTYRLYRWPVVMVIVVFVVSMLLGGVLPTEAKVYIFQAVGEKFADIILQSDSALGLSWNIFINNIVVAGLLYGLGFTIALGLLIIVSNGLIMGLFVSLLYRSETLVPGTFISSMISLLPHGIFELSAIFLAGVLSTMVIVKVIFHTYIEPHKTRRRFLLESVLRLVIVIVPLLMIASWIEVYVSTQLGTTVQNWLYPPAVHQELSLPLATNYVLQNNCVPVTYAPDDNITFDKNSLGHYANVLYDDAIYGQLQHRAAVSNTWQQFISCNDDITLSLQTWERAHWGLTEASDVEIAILNSMNTDFEQRSGTVDGIAYVKLLLHVENQPDSAVWLFEYDQITASIAISDASIQLEDIVANVGNSTSDSAK